MELERQAPVITLLTDFGLNDVYVGVLKGVIAQINPALTVVDLTHQIPPQNIAAAQFNLLNAYPYFPAGTVHVAVVDPGVGGARRSIALELSDGFLVGPDNGIFTGLLAQRTILHAVELTNTEYWRVLQPSNTFHGRDIFASVAAHLANGVPLLNLGAPFDPATLVKLPLATCTPTPTGFSGNIQYIDRFGNAITNIPGDFVQGKRWSVTLGKRTIPGCRTYSEAAPGQPLALIGSHGWVEIAINGGDAQFQLRLNWHDTVQVVT
ncbi:SAM-dependent chlorinase/fluorinase [Leptolyngbya sp. NK1-12]|uniref:SAM-dependent chlorinase/fluorinase n=1 Tax=Leptolyngbya sp. NK1-12 TaxID=2547451 RepID=A0AA97AQP7_9CYAN|nr:SAM-dependent chlorinase/fluorinase [Leptolyngbya sp. NK1-12]WNZ23958.1 SAM-dependent chlorinase/fluorinase [Leptolyngbya sp. NK1-12]